MKSKHFNFWALVLLVVLFCPHPCFAKAKATGYFFVVAYSFQYKTAYFSSVFAEKVKDCSYSDEEYCSDVALLQKIEAAFEKHIRAKVEGDLSRFTLAARGGHKNQAISKKRLEKEVNDFTSKGFKIQYATNFIFEK